MNLKEIIISKGIKQSWIAQQIGVSEVTVSNWVKGKSFPKQKHLNQLNLLLDKQLSSILKTHE